jgi:hypothetical protein
MDGASAMKLAVRLRDIVDVYPPRGLEDDRIVFRSSLHRAIEEEPVEATSHVVTSIHELTAMDPSGTVEMVMV